MDLDKIQKPDTMITLKSCTYASKWTYAVHF